MISPCPMDEAWARAIESVLESQLDSSSSSSSASSSLRTLTLDGAVKCLHGRLPPPNLLEKFQNLEHLSIANIGLSSLEKFPKLRNLQRLILSDNRIACGLEFLVEAGLDLLRDLDLSNNRIQFVEDLTPLADLKLVSLDLYECPVTRVNDYRSRVFAMIRSLKYLDKMDADENERTESDDEDDEEDDVGDEDDDEIDDGEARGGIVANGVIDADEDETSDADGEVAENGSHHHQDLDDDDEVEEDVDEVNEGDGMGEEIDADDGEDEDVIQVHNVGDSEDDDDGIERDDDDGSDDKVDEEEEDVEEEGGTESNGRLLSAYREIDGHDQGEEDQDSEDGEVDENQYSDGEDEEEDTDGYSLVRSIARPERGGTSGADSDACNKEDDEGEEVDVEESQPLNGVRSRASSSSLQKRKRGGENGALGDDSAEEEEDMRSSKHP